MNQFQPSITMALDLLIRLMSLNPNLIHTQPYPMGTHDTYLTLRYRPIDRHSLAIVRSCDRPISILISSKQNGIRSGPYLIRPNPNVMWVCDAQSDSRTSSDRSSLVDRCLFSWSSDLPLKLVQMKYDSIQIGSKLIPIWCTLMTHYDSRVRYGSIIT